MAQEWFFNQSAEQTLARIVASLAEAGFRVQWTFDIRSALMLAPDCICSYHGTSACDCRYEVLMVYGGTGHELQTLVVHGRDGVSWAALVERAGTAPDKQLLRLIDQLNQGKDLPQMLDTP